MPSNGTLDDYIQHLRIQKEKFREVAPIIADRMADALIAELQSRVPGKSKHPNATGNLLRALTKKTKPYRRGSYTVVVGVGDRSLVGEPGKKSYKPEPIRRFLDWWFKEKERQAGVARKPGEAPPKSVAEIRERRELEKAKAKAEANLAKEIGAAKAQIEAAKRDLDAAKKRLHDKLAERHRIRLKVDRYRSAFIDRLAVGATTVRFKSGAVKPISWLQQQIMNLEDSEYHLDLEIDNLRKEMYYYRERLEQLRESYAWIR